MNHPEKRDIERRVALFAALVGALAGLVGAFVGAAASIYVQHATATQTQAAQEKQAKQDACTAFVASAQRVDLLLNSIYLSSSYGPTQSQSDYISTLNQISNQAVPDMYGRQAAVQLITNRQDVSDSSNRWISTLVSQINYFHQVVAKADATTSRGFIDPQKYNDLHQAFNKARNDFINKCSHELGST
jgi:hypothetical protein